MKTGKKLLTGMLFPLCIAFIAEYGETAKTVTYYNIAIIALD